MQLQCGFKFQKVGCNGKRVIFSYGILPKPLSYLPEVPSLALQTLNITMPSLQLSSMWCPLTASISNKTQEAAQLCLSGTGTATKQSVINRKWSVCLYWGVSFESLIWRPQKRKICLKAMDPLSLNSGMNLHWCWGSSTSSQQLLPCCLKQHQNSYSRTMIWLTELSSLSSDSQPELFFFFSKLRGAHAIQRCGG